MCPRSVTQRTLSTDAAQAERKCRASAVPAPCLDCALASNSVPVDLHRTALDAHARQCWAVQKSRRAHETSTGGLHSAGSAGPQRLQRVVLCAHYATRQSEHGPCLPEAHAHRVCTLYRNAQVETIAHLGSVCPRQTRALSKRREAPKRKTAMREVNERRSVHDAPAALCPRPRRPPPSTAATSLPVRALELGILNFAKSKTVRS